MANVPHEGIPLCNKRLSQHLLADVHLSVDERRALCMNRFRHHLRSPLPGRYDSDVVRLMVRTDEGRRYFSASDADGRVWKQWFYPVPDHSRVITDEKWVSMFEQKCGMEVVSLTPEQWRRCAVKDFDPARHYIRVPHAHDDDHWRRLLPCDGMLEGVSSDGVAAPEAETQLRPVHTEQRIYVPTTVDYNVPGSDDEPGGDKEQVAHPGRMQTCRFAGKIFSLPSDSKGGVPQLHKWEQINACTDFLALQFRPHFLSLNAAPVVFGKKNVLDDLGRLVLFDTERFSHLCATAKLLNVWGAERIVACLVRRTVNNVEKYERIKLQLEGHTGCVPQNVCLEELEWTERAMQETARLVAADILQSVENNCVSLKQRCAAFMALLRDLPKQAGCEVDSEGESDLDKEESDGSEYYYVEKEEHCLETEEGLEAGCSEERDDDTTRYHNAIYQQTIVTGNECFRDARGLTAVGKCVSSRKRQRVMNTDQASLHMMASVCAVVEERSQEKVQPRFEVVTLTRGADITWNHAKNLYEYPCEKALGLQWVNRGKDCACLQNRNLAHALTEEDSTFLSSLIYHTRRRAATKRLGPFWRL